MKNKRIFKLIIFLFFSIQVVGQTITCDNTDLQGLFNLYGGKSSFSVHTVDVVTAFVQIEDEIEAENYVQAKSLLTNIFAKYPIGDNIWQNVNDNPNGANFGHPHAYSGLRMMEDIVNFNLTQLNAVVTDTVKMKIVLVGCSEGIQPTSQSELVNGTGPFVRNYIDQDLIANNYCLIRQSFDLFLKYVNAMTDGELVVDLEFIELPSLCLEAKVTSTSRDRAGVNDSLVWNELSNSVKESTDWWWVIYPSHVPEGPDFVNKNFGTGGMKQNDRGGPIFIIDDKFMINKDNNLGNGNFNDIERRIYLPQWLQHEFYHHIYHLYHELSLETGAGHDWFDRSFWRPEFLGQFESDYYTESFHKVIKPECDPLKKRLITRKRNFHDESSQISMADLIGSYSLDNIANNWHEGEIIMNGSRYFWRNKANIEWEVFPNLTSGTLETGTDCPYPGVKFEINFYQTSEGDFIPALSSLRFKSGVYKRRFNLLREKAPIELTVGSYSSLCENLLLDSGNITKQSGEYTWTNNKSVSWPIIPDINNDQFNHGASSPTPTDQFNLVIYEKDCELSVLGFNYLNAYYWKPKRSQSNASPTLISTIQDFDLTENFGLHQIDLSTIFSDPEGDTLLFFATSSNPTLISTNITQNQLILTGGNIGNSTILAIAVDPNGGVVMKKFVVSIIDELSVSNIGIEGSISISPNPVRDYVKISGQLAECSIRIYDLNKMVYEEQKIKNNLLEINLEQLSKGIYFIEILDDKDQLVKIDKLVKH